MLKDADFSRLNKFIEDGKLKIGNGQTFEGVQKEILKETSLIIEDYLGYSISTIYNALTAKLILDKKPISDQVLNIAPFGKYSEFISDEEEEKKIKFIESLASLENVWEYSTYSTVEWSKEDGNPLDGMFDIIHFNCLAIDEGDSVQGTIILDSEKQIKEVIVMCNV